MLLPFAVGCWSGTVIDPIAVPFWFLWIAVAALSWIAFHPGGWFPYPWRWIPGSMILLMFLLVGHNIAYSSFYKQPSSIKAATRYHLVEIRNTPVLKGLRLRMSVLCLGGSDGEGAWSSIHKNALLYSHAKSGKSLPRPGDIWLVEGESRPICPTTTPATFDFSVWAAENGMQESIRADSNGMFLIRAADWNIKAWAFDCRKGISDCFKESGLQTLPLGIVEGLLLGETDGIDNETMHAFSVSGTLHILSVSGMHVGMIYGFLVLLVAGISRLFEFKPIARILLPIVAVWMYALITGFSPAVARAAMVITLIAIGRMMRRRTDPLNLLAASAILLMATDPVLVRNMGFQLSYCAVAGILYFYPWLVEAVHIGPGKQCPFWRSRWLLKPAKMIWQAACLSVSAQLFTFPLGLLYFHSFPVYFLPANLVVVPLSGTVLFCSFITLLMTPFTALSRYCATTTSWLADFLVKSAGYFSHLPAARCDGVFITRFQCLLLLAIVVSLVVFLRENKKRFLSVALMLTVFYSASRIISRCSSIETPRKVMWKQRKGDAITIASATAAFTICEYRLSSDSQWVAVRLPDALDVLEVPEKNRFLILRMPEGRLYPIGKNGLNDR